ncbi:hypothetical protein FACS1894172_07950 [Spirochaetia bacterium]|nr:hypothetical protein FACS1894164_05970 [Spirochaetia bacterium]GHU32032.1 hypothetical protein FACS1894172_07950 [Spirochaetia bacterium]
MTNVKEQVVELINRMSDEKARYILNILKNIEGYAGKSDAVEADNLRRRNAAFEGFMQYTGRLPADFNYKKELAEYREERYGSSDRY